MREILKERSQNRRWGLTVVSGNTPDEYLAVPMGGGTPVLIYGRAVPGTVHHLGEDGSGSDVYRFDHDAAAETWLMAGGDLEGVTGAATVVDIGLQGNSSVTLLLLGTDAVVRTWGYKRRSSTVSLYRRGVKQKVSPALLLALGITPSGEPIRPTPEVPAVDPAVLKAMGEA